MTVDRTALKGAYARLKGLERARPPSLVAPLTSGLDYQNIVKQLAVILAPEDMSGFVLPAEAFPERAGSNGYCDWRVLELKLFQLISYLEYVYHVSAEIIEIGTLYNSIRDEQLRNRCADLLSAPGNFDRVINQATLVLEDRIRTRSKNTEGLAGAPLVNKVINSDAAKAILALSQNADEHRGFADICRGMVSAFRNPTHHQVSDDFSREDALKVCAFVDSLLRVVDHAEVRSAK